MSIHPVVLVGGGPGAWDLITVRGMQALQAADVIVADHLGPTAQLDKLCDVDAKELIDVSKIPYRKQVAQERINEILVEHAQAGRRVVRLKGGDPYVFGRGFEELTALSEAGVPLEVIPGVTSAVAVPALAGTPVTHRGMVHAFTVVSGHLPPGHPKSLVDWAALARSGATLSVIMGVKNAAAIAAALIDASLSPHTPVHIIQEGSLADERAFRCELAELGATMEAHSIAPPAVIVIGEVAGL
ncbi:uroporphyrinogen-III C-methyltransferase [Corynebacterium minutissimum]|uniref:uroporphyrinogen-III C-methyltransferase n=1 Tax=Corynebacterium minutissimum TaxID=38301 RepID=UPI001EF22F19|nr:uroporphyrinogen-III C-methyltransferase [Corynebacterium minutissimum]MCG7229991.1 uroporphyrinogen-III C-methyltransferase [Corynebacterium minutissimum]MCG7239630.1 uroporphyrinogen-III C-methyltransferase [Corynebacterium minutissimum]